MPSGGGEIDDSGLPTFGGLREFLGVEGPPPAGRVGKYRLIRKLGRGGMGTVYQAEDPELRREVALKIVREDEADPTTIARLHREAAIAAQLRHPGIVAVHEVGITRDVEGRLTHFISMDLVEGRTFADFLGEASPAREESLRILAGAAEAAAYAHAQGVVHRDLKPANILLDRSGRVFLTDFGLARARAFHTQLTQSNTLLGTPVYMAPEQVEGRADSVDARTDVYALGVILYEILTGRLPFDAATPAELYNHILRKEPLPPSRTGRIVERDLELICLKSLEKDRARRYADAGEFAEDLARFRRGEPVLARPPSWAYRLGKHLRRRRGIVAAVAVSVLLTATVAGFAVVRVSRDREFDSARRRAAAAFADRDWKRALAEAERGLRIRSHGDLEGIAEQSRAKIRSEAAALEEERARAAAYRRLEEEKVKPLLGKLAAARLRFYIPDIDLRKDLAEIEKTLRDLQTTLRDPFAAEHADLWLLLGAGWYMVNDMEEAERALLEADKRSRDPRVWSLLGRLYLERAIEVRHSSFTHGSKEAADQEIKRLLDKARSYLERIGPSAGRPPSIEGVLVEAYRAWTGGKAGEVERWCKEGETRFGRELGAEGFSLIRGALALGRNEREEAFRHFSHAVKRRPHYPLGRILFSNLYVMEGSFNLAEEELTRALQSHPRSAMAYHHRGGVRDVTRNLEGSLADYSEAIRLAPRFGLAYLGRAHVLEHLGRLDEAVEDCTSAIRVAPTLPAAYHARGLLRQTRARKLEAQGKREEAEVELRGAKEDLARAGVKEPTNADELVARAQRRKKAGDLRGAFNDYSEAIALDPKKMAPNVVDRGVVGAALSLRFLEEGREKEAEEYWRRAIADLETAGTIHPRVKAFALGNRGQSRSDRARLFDRLGRAKEAREEWTKAIADLSESIDGNPQNALVYTYRARAYRRLGDLARARRDYSTAIEKNPNLAVAYAGRAGVYEKEKRADLALADYGRALGLKTTRQERIMLLQGRALLLLKSDKNLALQDANEAVRLGKEDHPGLYELRGLILWDLRRLDEAIRDYTSSIRLNSRRREGYAGRAGVRAAKGDLRGAAEDYTEVLRRKTDYPPALAGRGEVRRMLGDWSGAIADFSEAIRLGAGSGWVHHMRGHAYEKEAARLRDAAQAKKMYEAALADFTKAMKLDSSLAAETYRDRSGVKMKMGDRDGAIADISESIRRRPDASGYYDRGLYRSRKGDLTGAVKDLTEAIRLRSEYAPAFAIRSDVFRRLKEWDAAFKDISEAIRLESSNGRHFYNRGTMRLARKEFPGALADLNEAVRLLPRLPEARANRGAARERLGDLKGAVVDYEAALAIAPADWRYRRAFTARLRAVRLRLKEE